MPKVKSLSGVGVKQQQQMARDLIAESADKIIQAAIDTALGKPIERTLKNGAVVKEMPSIQDCLKMQTTLLNKIVPDLKSTDVTVEAEVTHVEQEPRDPRQVARAIMSILGREALLGNDVIDAEEIVGNLDNSDS